MISDSLKVLFFLGKGGVGKTTISCNTANYLSKSKKHTYLLSIDPANNVFDFYRINSKSSIKTINEYLTVEELHLDKKKEEITKSRKAVIDSWIMKGFILFQTGLIVTLFLLWRRAKRELAKYHKSKLKNNIRNMREEKIKASHNPKLATLRSSLGNEAKRMEDFRKDITKQAKRYSIAKGEVHLAAKLNMMAEQK